MFEKKTVRDVEVKDQVVLVRTDYNVPLVVTDEGKTAVASDFRIREGLPTIKYLLENGAKKLILMSHMGRPEGRDEKLSLRVVAETLAAGLLPGKVVNFVDEVTGPEVKAAVEDLPEGGILLLENLRFDPREKAGSEELAREIVEDTRATLFVQDGFAVTHRAHASTVAVARLLPAVAGLLLEKEVTMLTGALAEPERPLVAVIGGAKVADKQPLIDRLLPVADRIIIGGKIAADGYESDHAQIYVAEDFDTDGEGTRLDIGPIATSKMAGMVSGAKTVIWNGLLGKAEDPAYSTSSTILAKILGERDDETSIVLGGDTSGFVEGLYTEDPSLTYSLISTGGGAALVLMSGGEMPGVEVLEGK